MTMRELIIARSAARVVAGFCRTPVDGVLPRRGTHATVSAESDVTGTPYRRITITVPREQLPVLFGRVVPGIGEAERELQDSLAELTRRTSAMLARMIERDQASFARERPTDSDEVVLRVAGSWMSVTLRETISS